MSGDHPSRKKLGDTRSGRRYKVELIEENIDVFILINSYNDTGEPAEVFATVSKQGSTLQGMLDGFCILASIALQYGVPAEKIIEKFEMQSFQPNGKTSHPDIPKCDSLLDLIAQVLRVDGAAPKVGG